MEKLYISAWRRDFVVSLSHLCCGFELNPAASRGYAHEAGVRRLEMHVEVTSRHILAPVAQLWLGLVISKPMSETERHQVLLCQSQED